MIKQLETQPTILNEEKLDISAEFFDPWSDTPDINLGEYTRTLNKRQRAAKKVRLNISYKDKTTHFVGCVQHSEIFEDKWTQKWEAPLDRDWTVVRDIWVEKYGEVTR